MTFLNNNKILMQFKTGNLECFDLNGIINHDQIQCLYRELELDMKYDKLSIVDESQ